eukprot:CAMPEP_0185849694 /NCGR_PEP_ID=MMETSP1354-20130828/4119_1 /TAXON_ID=708628 /ORGANISM="Erythrolobus madagascarensis, Strain CCMP3276" /LENGTH=159 /DNA_ID=CAMNT_0028550279 /DNA_START=243 /DNA_END=722 /DNA_ORIENTATION=+
MSLLFLLNRDDKEPLVDPQFLKATSVPSMTGRTASHTKSGSDSKGKLQSQRKKWTAEEDALLINLVENKGTKRWSDLAVHFPLRNSAQLRSRWAHRLADKEGNSMRPFTEEEDQWILKGHETHGTKWRRIAREMNGRLAHDVQNRFWFLQRRSKQINGL